MTDRPCSENKYEKSLCIQQPLILVTIAMSFCFLLSTCVPAAIKDPGGSNQGITRMDECEFKFKTEYFCLCLYVWVTKRK